MKYHEVTESISEVPANIGVLGERVGDVIMCPVQPHRKVSSAVQPLSVVNMR